MNTGSEWPELSGFLDGELDQLRTRRIANQMRDDPILRGRIQELEGLCAEVKSQARYYRAPETLRLALRTTIARRGRRRRAVAAFRQWFAWRPMASALALAGSFAFSVSLTDSAVSRVDQLQEEVVASHLRATMSRRMVDVASSDRRVVVPFLSARLDFSPRVDDLSTAGASLLGGRVDYLNGRAVAAVVYRVGDHVVDSFVWPTRSADTPVTRSGKRGFQLARWSRGGMAHCLISDVSPAQFATLVHELESSAAEPASS